MWTRAEATVVSIMLANTAHGASVVVKVFVCGQVADLPDPSVGATGDWSRVCVFGHCVCCWWLEREVG
jgi:hypothetical protein